MRKFLCLFLFLNLFIFSLNAQTNLRFSDAVFGKILEGNYAPSNYHQSTLPSSKNVILNELKKGISADSLLNYLVALEQFKNRNTGSDTLSLTNGIGAARNWALAKFKSFATAINSPLLSGFFQFDKMICSMATHKNVVAILPGTDTSAKGFIILEAHLDSRCENACDTACIAQGMEDNGSGVALVLELARVMSKQKFSRTIVFMLTTAEEQGLDGANAFAIYCKTNNLPVRAVLNNDVIGGIICGKTASPPGCPAENDVDSINVRIFSAGSNYSQPKGLARFVKLSFEEEMLPLLDVKTQINIMNAEDRVGRGGDHIPFRQQGYAAIRFSSANEHGDANPQPGYVDRQHSTRDILGKDQNADGKIDDFYVNTNYLQRNAQLNGTAAAMLALGPQTAPDFDLVNDGNGLSVIFKNPIQPYHYRIGFRSRNNTFDTLINLIGANDLKTYHVKQDSFYFISVARVDAQGIESMFSIEKYVKVLGVPPTGLNQNVRNDIGMQLLPVSPNPIDETLTLSVWVKTPKANLKASILITDLQGKIVTELPIVLDQPINEVIFNHGFSAKGLYHCSLFVEEQLIDTQKIWFK
jgi:hypothetical protein